MTNYKERFSFLKRPEKSGVVKTGDDTPHPIEHIVEVPLNHVGHKGKLRNIMHVPTIIKNLVVVRTCSFRATEFQWPKRPNM